MNRNRIGRGAARALALGMGVALLGAALPAGALQRVELEELRPEEARIQPDHIAVRALGRVREVSRDGRTFMLDTGEMRLQVEYGADRGRPGFGFRLPELREGDRVVVYGRLAGPAQLLASRVVTLGPGEVGERRLTGQVRTADSRRNRRSVRTDRGELVEVDYGARTTVARLGRRATPADVRVGDRVWAEGRWIGRDRLFADRIEVTDTREAWRNGEMGEILSVDRRDSVLQVRFPGDVRRVELRDAVLLADGRRANPDRLRRGVTVRVFGEERGGAIRARRVELLDDFREGDARFLVGRVRSVDPGERILLLEAGEAFRSLQRVYVPRDVVIDRNGRRLDLREVQTGDRVRIRGERRDGILEAESITVVR